ncbi:MAG: 50S ribosomal protein L32 [Chloroflexus sp.]|jgi:large subunit ribosomal protein L32|uniref:Large ribosomal subunit protein bL32 n=1 Tax=Chloroflexus aggregans (strain MD-66 / DSM 9485) TaxID=326427 RepID=B8G6N9_CHLAD|nr:MULTISPECIES: 50S ribosomal protein L32 [Chloroflexus]ACL25848.1 ribosomal protein L32 [Chloroflexus aggregans DSM 9485]RMD82153.1 MAG: 50S ribosomal protein L32 [Chloroflexota bacterium]GIV87808.1 MAG: 50S ribosomal protein L32 [Chloroflexus sp.]
MGAVPKRKVSRHRRGNRRQHLALTPPVMVTCPRCGELMRAHRVCLSCGYYKGRQILKVGAE